MGMPTNPVLDGTAFTFEDQALHIRTAQSA
jgi:hypothetical protein